MSDFLDRAQRQLVRKRQAGVPRRRWSRVGFEYLGFVAAALAVVGVIAVFSDLRGPGPSGSAVKARGLSVVFSISPLGARPPLGPSIERSVDILGDRLRSVFHSVRVSRAGNEIVVVVRDPAASPARVLALSVPARLAFYDWETNALTPNGKTVASQLQIQDATALEISQGSGSAGPGDAGAGSMRLYSAVKLAASRPSRPSRDNSRSGSQYYLFGSPGSAACAAAAKDRRRTPRPRIHCLLSGPDASQRNLMSRLPSGVSASQGQQLVVRPGTVVLQAAEVNARHPTSFDDPSAQFYVLMDKVALPASEISAPMRHTDPSGIPDVEFGFSAKGKADLRRVTAAEAHRGGLVSGLDKTLDQHFAVALDDKLITVPSIDFRLYPNGIPGDNGAAITGGFTIQSAENLATLLRFGAMPVSLEVRKISVPVPQPG